MGTVNYQLLEQLFHITTHKKENPVFSAKARELLKLEKMELLVRSYAPLIKSTDLPAVATFFTSWFNGVALGLHYMISVWNRSIDFSLDHLTIELHQKEERGVFSFVIDNGDEVKSPGLKADRAVWREQQYRLFYGGTAVPLFQSLAAATGIEIGMIWGQLPTKFNYYMDILIQSTDDAAAKQQLAEDYQYLCHELDPAVFGRPKNPFDVKVRWIEDAKDSEKKVRMKNVCCLYHQTEGGEYCYTCPKLKERERAERRYRLRAEAK